MIRVTPRPPGFVSDLVYEVLPHGGFRLVEDLVYEVNLRWFAIRMVVSAGFECDGASVPRLAQVVISKESLAYAGWVHDAMFYHAFNKFVADAIFYMIARTNEQAGRIRGHLAFRAVQVGGWWAWLRHWRRRKREAP